MIYVEVNCVENQNEQDLTPQDSYEPRPRWQIWAARIGLVLFIGLVILQLLQIAGGGL